jgi:hypothetical protein
VVGLLFVCCAAVCRFFCFFFCYFVGGMNLLGFGRVEKSWFS